MILRMRSTHSWIYLMRLRSPVKLISFLFSWVITKNLSYLIT